jgi:hypothetical protein
MEQRRLRLGDILDDYCPRERRLTNHAIVAMIEDEIKQTRCTTCDAEHPYKGARVPKRRKKESPVVAGALALAGDLPAIEPADTPAAVLAVSREDAAPREEVEYSMHHDEDAPGPSSDVARDIPSESLSSRETESPTRQDDAPAIDGPVHRPLIRATLPRPEGQKDARPLPDFTIRHSPGRGPGGHGGNGHFRGDRMRMRGGNANGNGNSYMANGNRIQGGGSRYQGGPGNRPGGPGRQAPGRGGQPGFRNAGGPNGKRGRGSRG